MSLQNLLAQFASSNIQEQSSNNTAAASNPLSSLASAIPGGLAGGAAAGGVMALLMGSKSTRKMVGSVAKVGGTAVLGGLAFQAFSNWKQNKAVQQAEIDAQAAPALSPVAPVASTPIAAVPLHLTLVKAMISAAKSDGYLDPSEQKIIFDSVEKMQLNPEEKAAIFDAISRDIPVQELADAVTEDSHKAEVYLSAYLAIEVDDEKERAFLDSLATALSLPDGLPAYLEEQAQTAV